MTTKEEYEKIGETLKGEAVYRNKKNGCICTEKDHSYLVFSTLREIDEANMAIIEESCGNMDVWIPTGERDSNGRRIFTHRKSGRKMVIGSDDSMEIIKKNEESYELKHLSDAY